MGTKPNTLRLAATIFLAAIGGATMAQDGPSPTQILLGNQIFTAFRKDVRQELKVTDGQFQKMLDAFDGTVEVDGDAIRVQISGGQDLNEMSKACMKVLDTAQLKRLEEIWLQRVGALAILEEKYSKALHVTETQLKQANGIAEKAGAQVLDLMMSGNHDEESMKKSQKIREDASKDVAALLNADQLKTLESLKGKPYQPKKS